ncbi:MAG: hypothetical protein U1D30_26085 [Planctomycetota bacterium]
MSLKMHYLDPTLETWIEVDFVTSRVCDLELQFSYSHPARLSWTMHQAQHATPIPHRAFLQFTDDDYLAGTWSTPFRRASTKSPGAAANAEIPLRRLRSNPPSRPGSHHYERRAATFHLSRAVFNVKIDNDDDRAFEIEHDATTDEILRTLFDNATSELAAMQAAPIAGTPYVASDLAPLDYKSQEKIVFGSETLRGGVDRLLGLYPQFRILFHPGDGMSLRTWRFLNVAAAPAVTLTLNDFQSENPHHVLSMKLSRSLEGRYSAVKIYGPEKTAAADVHVLGGGLDKLWNPAFESGFGVSGPAGSPTYADVARVWQISHPDRRHMANILPAPLSVENYSTDGGQTSLTVFLRTPAAPGHLG